MNSYSDKQPHAFDLKHYMLSNVCRRSCPRASSGCQRLGAQAAKAGMSSIFNFLKSSDAIKKEYDIESKGATPCAFIRLPSRPSAQLRGVRDAWQGRGACRLWWWLLLRCAEYTCSRPPHPSSAPDSDLTVCDAVLGQGKFAKVYKVRLWLQGVSARPR